MRDMVSMTVAATVSMTVEGAAAMVSTKSIVKLGW